MGMAATDRLLRSRYEMKTAAKQRSTTVWYAGQRPAEDAEGGVMSA
jgi:hypothetical protein